MKSVLNNLWARLGRNSLHWFHHPRTISALNSNPLSEKSDVETKQNAIRSLFESGRLPLRRERNRLIHLDKAVDLNKLPNKAKQQNSPSPSTPSLHWSEKIYAAD